MLTPLVITKQIKFPEDEWQSIYQAAKAQGLDPVRFIKKVALDAAKKAGKP